MAGLHRVLGAALLLGGCALPRGPAPAPGAEWAPPAAPAPAPAPAPVPAATAPPALPRYRCENGLEFEVRFGDGSAQLRFASRAPELLLRDAGGTSPQHVVYSSTHAKAEFGLGADGREAKLNLVAPPVEARCVLD